MSDFHAAVAARDSVSAALNAFYVTHEAVFTELAVLKAAVEAAEDETDHFRHCACGEECGAQWDNRLPIPAGWKVAHCPCGNPMNAYGDIYIDAPAALCPVHPSPEIVKHWVCMYCHSGSGTILVTDASKLGDDGFIHL